MTERTYYILTFGCQMNKLDSELAAGQLEMAGYSLAESAESADLVLLNTCSVRAKAQVKATSLLCNFTRDVAGKSGRRIVGIMGCVAQQMQEKLTEAPYLAEFVLGSRAVSRLAEVLERLAAGERGILALEEDCASWDYEAETVSRLNKRSAYVAISRGCSNFCTYCIVPYVRGPIQHRRPESIVDEVRSLTDSGYIDICLLGQNVNAYDYDGCSFVNLLERVASIGGIRRLRFITTHPKDLCIDTVRMMVNPPFAPYISLPLQSGSDRILGLMNRGYTRGQYMEKVSWLKEYLPGAFISTDIMVGFPGETEADFEDTLEIVRKAQFDNIYSFVYSTRPRTKAASLMSDVPDEVIKARFKRLLALQRQNHIDRLKRFVGETVEVLIDGVSKKDKGAPCGRTPQHVIVNLPHDKCDVGELVEVTITGAGIRTLLGKVTKRIL
ncbi:MAG: tRNA (N6-isopentenyl adenosine(37)-C2)-methylthiotransferase MiaB [Candidatus Coatesbacteria bacterium]|nr:tRNA (N6-isopentenyl adenosine(37)-C2)-methylthiotransferase MiaB [Candidatus Coatesbacteria bacterium]